VYHNRCDSGWRRALIFPRIPMESTRDGMKAGAIPANGSLDRVAYLHEQDLTFSCLKGNMQRNVMKGQGGCA